MKKRIKDLTKEEIERLPNKGFITITSYEGKKTITSKLFIIHFLNDTIDIPQPHILDKEEHDYLRAVCKPYKVEYIKKAETGRGDQFIEIWLKSSLYCCATESWSMPFFKSNSMYKGMEVDKKYTIEELELDKEWEE